MTVWRTNKYLLWTQSQIHQHPSNCSRINQWTARLKLSPLRPRRFQSVLWCSPRSTTAPPLGSESKNWKQWPQGQHQWLTITKEHMANSQGPCGNHFKLLMLLCGDTLTPAFSISGWTSSKSPLQWKPMAALFLGGDTAGTPPYHQTVWRKSCSVIQYHICHTPNGLIYVLWQLKYIHSMRVRNVALDSTHLFHSVLGKA